MLSTDRFSENPHVKEEIKREDPSLVNRVNKLQLEVTDEAPKVDFLCSHMYYSFIVIF